MAVGRRERPKLVSCWRAGSLGTSGPQPYCETLENLCMGSHVKPGSIPFPAHSCFFCPTFPAASLPLPAALSCPAVLVGHSMELPIAEGGRNGKEKWAAACNCVPGQQWHCRSTDLVRSGEGTCVSLKCSYQRGEMRDCCAISSLSFPCFVSQHLLISLWLPGVIWGYYYFYLPVVHLLQSLQVPYFPFPHLKSWS